MKVSAIHFGHHDVQQDQVWFFLAGGEEGDTAVIGHHHPIPLLGQIFTQQDAYIGFVINNENRFSSP